MSTTESTEFDNTISSYDDLIKYGNEQRVKEAGRARLEGKDYVMQDGDICLFRFNVTK